MKTTDNSIRFTKVSYAAETLSFKTIGLLTYTKAMDRLANDKLVDDSVVLVPSTLKVSYDRVVKVEPHPGCRAKHELEWIDMTYASIRAFRGVHVEHRSAIEALGADRKTVECMLFEGT